MRSGETKTLRTALTVSFQFREEDLPAGDITQKERLLKSIMENMYNDPLLFAELAKAYIPELLNYGALTQNEINALWEKQTFRALAEKAAIMVSQDAEQLARDIYDGNDPEWDGDKLEGFIRQRIFDIRITKINTETEAAPGAGKKR